MTNELEELENRWHHFGFPSVQKYLDARKKLREKLQEQNRPVKVNQNGSRN